VNQNDYNEKNIEINGSKWHIKKLAEECAELAAAILQWDNKGANFDNIQKEIADVKIAILYFEMTFGTDDINRYINKKYKRINKKVREQMKERNEN